MTFEENREFSRDTHQIVKPLSQNYVGVVLDYWQLFQGNDGTNPARFLRKYGLTRLDTAEHLLLSPTGEKLEGPRSWKNNNGFTAKELADFASRYPAGSKKRNFLRLSWFMVDPDYYRVDLTAKDADPSQYTSTQGALTGARKVRRPLVRVDGNALSMLEGNQEFLSRHVRQFWWMKGDPNKPARLVVLNSHDVSSNGKATELTGACPPGRVPVVMATIDLSKGVDLAKISPVLDGAWRQYMMKRPSNADNLTFAKENINDFKAVDAHIRGLAKEGKLLAPGGRKLYSKTTAQASAR